MSESTVISFVCLLARVSAFIGFVPLFGRRQLPIMVKAGLALALTVFWWDSMPSAKRSEGGHAFEYALMLGQEIGIGLMLAMLVGFLLVPARIAGSYIGQEIGVSMDPVTNAGFEQSTIVAMIFETFAVLLFFGLNLHHFMVLFVHYSFASLQSLSFTELPTEDLVALTGKLPEYGLLIMAPVGVMAFVVLVALFLLSKAAPTLNLFSVGMPLRVGLGVLSLFIFLPVLWTSIEAYFYRMIGELEQFMGYFVSG